MIRYLLPLLLLVGCRAAPFGSVSTFDYAGETGRGIEIGVQLLPEDSGPFLEALDAERVAARAAAREWDIQDAWDNAAYWRARATALEAADDPADSRDDTSDGPSRTPERASEDEPAADDAGAPVARDTAVDAETPPGLEIATPAQAPPETDPWLELGGRLVTGLAGALVLLGGQKTRKVYVHRRDERAARENGGRGG